MTCNICHNLQVNSLLKVLWNFSLLFVTRISYGFLWWPHIGRKKHSALHSHEWYKNILNLYAIYINVLARATLCIVKLIIINHCPDRRLQASIHNNVVTTRIHSIQQIQQLKYCKKDSTQRTHTTPWFTVAEAPWSTERLTLRLHSESLDQFYKIWLSIYGSTHCSRLCALCYP